MPNFREYNHEQGFFCTLIPDKILEEDHPARIISLVVENMDLENLYLCYSEEGNSSYHPKMMLKVLFYGYYDGTFSGRKIQNNLTEKASYIYLSGNQVPDFRTINNFRVRHLDIIPELFTQIVFLCVKLGMVDFKYLAVDGQKIHANASLRKSYNLERLEKRYDKIVKGLWKLIENEIIEPEEKIKDEKRIKKLKEEKKKLEDLKRTLKKFQKKGKEENTNITDKNAKVMKFKDSTFKPAYNHQSAVDGLFGITTAVETTQNNDLAEDLKPLVKKSVSNTQSNHENVLGDCAFNNYENIEELLSDKNKEKYFVPDRQFEREENGEKGKYDLSKFVIKDSETVFCPEGKKMKKIQKKYYNGYRNYIYEGLECGSCLNRPECTSGNKRIIEIDGRMKSRDKMRERLKSDEGKKIYSKRKEIIENLHGNDQKNKKWTQHLLRGIKKAEIEFMLIRIGSNLGKIIRYRSNELLAMMSC